MGQGTARRPKAVNLVGAEWLIGWASPATEDTPDGHGSGQGTGRTSRESRPSRTHRLSGSSESLITVRQHSGALIKPVSDVYDERHDPCLPGSGLAAPPGRNYANRRWPRRMRVIILTEACGGRQKVPLIGGGRIGDSRRCSNETAV